MKSILMILFNRVYEFGHDGLAARHTDGITVAEFEFDSHAVRKYDPV